jgi:MarR family 2-MHQ and catechol resistance regulon transcriptional repressor
MKIEEAIQQKKFDSPQQKAWINMVYTYNWINDQLNIILKDFDITQQQYNVLRILRGRHPQQACCSDVKDVMLDKNPDLTRLCDRLLTKGWIERGLNEDNRRQVVLTITEDGLNLLKSIEPMMKKHLKTFNNLSDKDAEVLSELLDKLRG